MFIIVILSILVLSALGLFLVGKVKIDEGTRHEQEVNLRPYSAIPLGIAALTALVVSGYTQDPGEAGVIRSFTGKVQGVDTTPGLGFTAPWNRVIKFDIRNQKIEMFSNRDVEGADGSAIQSPLQGSSNAEVSITVGYDIIPTAVEEIYNQYRDQEILRDRALRPGVRDEVRKATANFPPFQVKERRAGLTEDIRKRLSDRWEPIGVSVVSVDLGNLQLDPKTEEALQVVNQRQAEVESARAALTKAYIEAERVKTEAQAQADSDQIVRCGAATRTETRDVAGKPEQITIITPKQGAECEDRLNEQVLTSKYLDTLTEIGEKGNMIVVIPNEPSGGQNGPIINIPPPR